MDSSCVAARFVLGGGGTIGTLLRIETARLLQLDFVQVGDICQGEIAPTPSGAPSYGAPPTDARSVGASYEASEVEAVAPVTADAAQSSIEPRSPSSHLSGGGHSGVQQRAAATLGTTGPVPLVATARGLAPRFLVDSMMGWLRVIGVDTLLRAEGETNACSSRASMAVAT